MRQTTASGGRPTDSLAIRTQRGDNRIVTNGFDHNVRAEVIEGFMGTNTYEYAYDHQGRMVWKEISRKVAKTQSWEIEKTVNLLWDGYNIVQATIENQQSTITNHFVWGLDLSGSLQGAGGVGGLLAEIQNGVPYFATFDANGNVTEYLSTNGVTAAHYEYSPFGEIVVQSGDLADSFTHRFSTKPWCAVTGLSEYEFRKYGPGMGRWLSRDPMEEWISANLYSMTDNEPIQKWDYLGLAWVNPNPNWPPIKKIPGPGKGAGGATLAIALLNAAQQLALDAMGACDGPCVKASECLSCCNTATYTGLAAALGSVVLGNIECFKLGNPFAIAACIGAVDYYYKRTTDTIVDSQGKCLSGCQDNPL